MVLCIFQILASNWGKFWSPIINGILSLLPPSSENIDFFFGSMALINIMIVRILARFLKEFLLNSEICTIVRFCWLLFLQLQGSSLYPRITLMLHRRWISYFVFLYLFECLYLYLSFYLYLYLYLNRISFHSHITLTCTF